MFGIRLVVEAAVGEGAAAVPVWRVRGATYPALAGRPMSDSVASARLAKTRTVVPSAAIRYAPAYAAFRERQPTSPIAAACS
jgi:hypothetical protein